MNAFIDHLTRGAFTHAPRARGQQKISGTVNGDKAVFGFAITRDGQPFKATYSGTIESATTMTGTVEFSGALNGSGTWSATRK